MFRCFPPMTQENLKRTGVFMVLGLLCLAFCLTFVAYSVDVGYIVLMRTKLQNAVDSAALAAAQEITAAVEGAPSNLTGDEITEYARDQAKLKAVEVANLNGIYVDGARDVEFGRRTYDPVDDSFTIEWGVSPSNCVRVTAHRDNPDSAAPDAALPLFFAPAAGRETTTLVADAIAYVEARDLVVIHDFSRSMNFDSYYSTELENPSQLTRDQLANYALIVYDDLNRTFAQLPRIPEYLTITQSEGSLENTVEFKYNKAQIGSNGTLLYVDMDFTDGTTTNWTNPLPGLFSSSKNIDNVFIRALIPNPQPYSSSTNGITVAFSADRKSATITTTSPRSIKQVDSFFEAGGSSSNTPSGTVYTYTVNKSSAIDYVNVRTLKNGTYSWNTFNPPDVTVEQTFYDSNANVMAAFGMDLEAWPYPSGSWDGFINFCRSHSKFRDDDAVNTDTEFRERYGGLTLVNYLMKNHSTYAKCPELYKTRHFPFHAIKEGHILLCDFLQGLGFDDQLGMVSYDTQHRMEHTLNFYDPALGQDVTVDISADMISTDFEALRNLMRYKQASHYYSSTNMGGGLKDGVAMLDASARPGTRPTLLLMTDGNTNTIDSGVDTSLPVGWDWDALFDYDDDGAGDYYTSSSQKHYCLKLAKEAVDKGYTIHCMSVGSDGDSDLLEAIAFMGKGHHINVPGGQTVSDMEADVEAAFHKIATLVPPARLQDDPDTQ